MGKYFQILFIAMTLLLWGCSKDNNMDEPEEEVFSISVQEVQLPASGGNFEITVIANIGYYISSKSDWIEEIGRNSNNQTNSTVYSFKVGANTNNEARKGSIIFCNDKQVCVPVAVIQAENANSQKGDFYHQSVAMHFTATWCSFCPKMSTALKTAQKLIPNKLETISIHVYDSDLLFNDYTALQKQFIINAYPSGIIDGRSLVENQDINEMADLVKREIEKTETTYPTASGISFTSTISEKDLAASIKLHLKSADYYKVTALVVEDSIVGFQAGVEDDYIHNGVVRVALSNILGDEFKTDTDNSVKEFSFNKTLPDGYNSENLRIVVYVQRRFGSQPKLQTKNYGEYYIDNCASGKVGTTVELKMAE